MAEKVLKRSFLGFWGKKIPFIYAFFFQHDSANDLSTFYRSEIFGRNLVFELWSKNLKTNQNAIFFKLQYLTNKLRYEIDFLDVTRVP